MILRFPILILDGKAEGPKGIPLTKENVRFLPHCSVSRNFHQKMSDRLGICELHLVPGDQAPEIWAKWNFPADKLPNTFHLYPAVGGVWDKAEGYFSINEVAICLTKNEDPRIKSLQEVHGVEVIPPAIPQVKADSAEKVVTDPPSDG